jgi:thioredoxin reductase (NADPH)
VAVVGGGNAALEEAEYLTRFASKVYVIHRRNEFRADSIIVERVLSNPKIEPIMGYVVDEISGDAMVDRVELKNVSTLEAMTIRVEGVFIFIGMKPEADFLDGNDGIKRAQGGWIITDDKMETSVEGVFAAGDVRDKFLRQVVTATGDGATAAMAAYEYNSNLRYLNSVLFGKQHTYALLISGLSFEHLELARSVEKWKKSAGADVTALDVYRAQRVMNKLGAGELPAIVEVSDGRAVRVSRVSSAEDVKSFILGVDE